MRIILGGVLGGLLGSLTLGGLALGGGGCAPDFDARRPDDPHTFGERVVTRMCKRIT
ncbi:MAG TPA: hypothetical protein VGC42_17590 [Kofleriaceae bacterium]